MYRNHQTDVVFNVSTINVDIFGNCSPIEQIIFNGEMNKGKIGHLLPLNYGIGKDTLPIEE